MAYLLQHLLEATSFRFPEEAAVECTGQICDYAALADKSRRLARLLVEAGLQRGDRVGLCLPKSFEAIVSIFGVLQAGGVYVPLDYTSPPRRQAWMVRDCRMRAVVTNTSRAALLLGELDRPPFPEIVVLVSEGEAAEPPAEPAFAARMIPWSRLEEADAAGFQAPHQTEDDLAYVLYTSGSTGTPKGVMISHRAALTFVDWAGAEVRLTPRDRVANQAPLQFDLSTFEIFAPVCHGSTIVPVAEELSSFPRDLAAFWESGRISVWYSVPSVLSRLLEQGELEKRDLSWLRTVLFAGEVFPIEHFRRLARLLPKVEFYNLYGPTETNVCTFHRVEDLPPGELSIPIGRACPNADVWAVTESGELAAPGETGELWVTGPLLMKGYWGLPERTRQAFAQVPSPGGWGRIQAYRTGDLVEISPSGEFVFRGRRDSMIKLRGYRIELGEVEAALYQHPDVLEVGVICLSEGRDDAMLAAFAAPRDSAELEDGQLRNWLRERLPSYMIPSLIEIRPELPRTSTGKVDKMWLLKELGASS